MTSQSQSLSCDTFVSILDAIIDPVVFCDLNHTICFMNKAAIARFRGDLCGRSLFDFHVPHSNQVCLQIIGEMKEGLDERLVIDHLDKRIFMRAVRDKSGKLIGYFERYEWPLRQSMNGQPTSIGERK